MSPEKKRKSLYVTLKVASILISCFFPILAVVEKFPVWVNDHGQGKSIGVGAIIIMVAVTIIFRKSVFGYLSDKFKLKHAPPLFIWMALLVVSYILIFINTFVKDLTVVLWMGVLGCAIGTALTYVAENHFGNKENSDG